MKMTNAEIVNRHALLIQIGKKRLPRKVSYAIARNITTLEREVSLIKRQFNDVADKYAVKDKSGDFVLEHTGEKQYYTFACPEDSLAYKNECRTINEIEVEVNVFTVNASELDKCEEDTRFSCLTPVEEASIDWMLEYT